MRAALTFLVLALAGPVGAVPADGIADRLRGHVETLAADDMAGRETGTPGFDRAARYVADAFAAAGLKPLPGHGWFQEVPLVALTPAATGTVRIRHGGEETVLASDEVALALPARLSDEHVSGEVVLAGNCNVHRDAGVDDFSGIHVRGRIAACAAGASVKLPREQRLAASEPAEKAATAAAHGAIGIVMLQSAGQAETTRFTRIARAFRAPRLVLESLPARGRVLALLSYAAAQRLTNTGGPMWLDIRAAAGRRRVSSNNVVGWLPGRNRPREAVIVSAHLDHLGDHVDPAPGTADRIANGAIDNAIGVAAMIESARALAVARPDRSVVFVAFTGEEEGLLGSRWFVAKRPSRMPGMRTNVNIDMPILTYQPSGWSLLGTGWYKPPLLAAAGMGADLPMTGDPGNSPPSDQRSFADAGIPTYLPLPEPSGDGIAASRAFWTERYHRASDDMSQPIDWDAATKYVDLVTRLVLSLSKSR